MLEYLYCGYYDISPEESPAERSQRGVCTEDAQAKLHTASMILLDEKECRATLQLIVLANRIGITRLEDQAREYFFEELLNYRHYHWFPDVFREVCEQPIYSDLSVRDRLIGALLDNFVHIKVEKDLLDVLEAEEPLAFRFAKTSTEHREEHKAMLPMHDAMSRFLEASDLMAAMTAAQAYFDEAQECPDCSGQMYRGRERQWPDLLYRSKAAKPHCYLDCSIKGCTYRKLFPEPD